jgi:hypothetical protein
MVVDKRRRQVTKEFEGLSHAGRIDYCVKKLARIDQLEGDVRNMMASPSYVPSDAPACAEAVRELTNARRQWLGALEGLNAPPTVWQRVNAWVNAWAEQDRLREQAREQGRRNREAELRRQRNFYNPS